MVVIALKYVLLSRSFVDLVSASLTQVVFSATDWFFFLVLDIGTPAITSIPLGVRFIIGLLQATAVRSAGFGTVALSALAPAVK